MPEETKELSFGEKAVGFSFNPGGDPEVTRVKALFATGIDIMNDLRAVTESKEVARMCSVAITEMQTAQMWAVKAVTWKD